MLSFVFLWLFACEPTYVWAGEAKAPAPASAHGPAARGFPSHSFQWAPRRYPRGQLNLHAGLSQPLFLGGYNVAADFRIHRLVFEYSHGFQLDYGKNPQIRERFDVGRGLELVSPWTTGFGVGYILFDEFFVMLEAKAHHYEVNYAGESAAYTTYSVGPALGWRFFIWRGLNLTAYLRYWPNIADSRSGKNITIGRDARDHKLVDLGLFANLSLGWAFDL